MEVCANDNITKLYNAQQQAHSRVAGDCTISNTDFKEGESSTKQKIGVGICSALGVAAGLMLLAKLDKTKGYSINPKKMFKGKFKDSYLANAKYRTKEIMAIGAGSILGGLAGGIMFDKKENFSAKLREGIIQFTNISLPIAFVELLSTGGKVLSKKTMPDWDKSASFLRKTASKLPAVAGSAIGLITGIYTGNRASNKLNEKIFKKKDDRPVKLSDFSAHIDDICVAATFIDEKNLLTKIASRFIPAALLVAGNETGNKKET